MAIASATTHARGALPTIERRNTKLTHMKKIALLTVVLFAIFAQIKGQEKNTIFGLQSGISLANIQIVGDKYNIYGTDDDLISYNPALSFNINAYIEFQREGMWNLSLEPGYIRKGAIQNSFGTTEDYRLILNYIQMPILANFRIHNRISLSIGPEIAYLINAKVGERGNSKQSFDISHSYEDYRRFLLELTGLVGLNYEIFEKTEIGIRYNHGILYNKRSVSYSHPIGGQPTGTIVKETNQYLQLLLRYKI